MQKINSILLSFVTIFIGLIVLLLSIFVLPHLATETVRIHPEVDYLKYPVLLGMYATAIPFFYAIYETFHMIRIVERETLFSQGVLNGLNRIKFCAMTIITLYVLGFMLLNFTNALPPLIAIIGLVIILITILVAVGAAYFRTLLRMQQPQQF